MHVQFIGNLTLRPVIRLSWVSEILNSNDALALITPIIWLEGRAIDKFGKFPKSCKAAPHFSIPSNSFIPRWISSSSLTRSARISFGARWSIASCTTSL